MASWRLARSLQQLQRELDKRFPDRLKPDWTIGDAAHRNRASDHNPNAQGVVCAIDVRSRVVAQYLWAHINESRDDRVKYAIHDSRIVNSSVSPWIIRSYSGSNPHSDHIHVSVGRGPSGSSTRPDLYDDTSSWGIADGNAPRSHEEDDVLKRGDEGSEVRYVQEQVNRVLTGRHDTGPLTIDGQFGPKTEDAVKQAQRKLGWKQTGEVHAAFSDRMLHVVLYNDLGRLEIALPTAPGA